MDAVLPFPVLHPLFKSFKNFWSVFSEKGVFNIAFFVTEFVNHQFITVHVDSWDH